MNSKKCLYLFLFAGVCVIFCPSLLRAQGYSRGDAINLALVEAQVEAGKTLPPAIIEDPQNQIQPQEDPAFRQRLRQEITEKKETEYGLAMDNYYRYVPFTSMTAQPGRIAIMDIGNEMSYEFKVADKLPIEIGLVTRFINLNGKEAMDVSIPAKLTRIAMRTEVTVPAFLEKLYLRMGITPTCNSDDWNCNASTLRIPGHMMLIYQLNEQWIFVAGVAGFPSYETKILPFGGLIYKPNDKLIFNLVPERMNVTYNLTDKLAVFCEGDMSGEEFKVVKDGYKGAILQYNEVHAGTGLSFKINKNINTSLTLGRMFNRNLKYRDSLGKLTMKNAYYSEFRLEMEM